MAPKGPNSSATRRSRRSIRSLISSHVPDSDGTDELSATSTPNSAAKNVGESIKALSIGVASQYSASPSLTHKSTTVIRRSSRFANIAISAGGSVSSAPTRHEESSQSDCSTPATSKVSTPAALEPLVAKPKSSIEVQLPGKSELDRTRSKQQPSSSIYSLSRGPNRRAWEIDDSDDAENLSDSSADTKNTKPMKKEKVDDNSLSGLSRDAARALPFIGRPLKAVTPSQISVKRERATTLPSTTRSGRVSKRAKLDASLSGPAPTTAFDDAVAASIAYAQPSEDETSNLSSIDSQEYQRSIPDSVLSSENELSDVAAGLDSKTKAPVKVNGPGSKSRPNIVPKKRTTERKRKFNREVPQSAATRVSIAEAHDEAMEDPNSDDDFPFMDSASSPDAGDSEEEPLSSNRRNLGALAAQRRAYRVPASSRRERRERSRLEQFHPEINTMWNDLERMPILKAGRAPQPTTISRTLKQFQLEGLAWMKEMEKMEWRGGLLGDEMGLGKTIQAVSLVMSDYPAKQPSLVLVPPVALMQWQSEIKSYTDGTLKTFVFHGTNTMVKGITVKELKQYDIIMMSYNSLESMYRKQEKGFPRKDGVHKEKSVIHAINFHRIILDEAHSIKTRTTMTAKACFALKTDFRWCLTGTPLQNRIGEFFSLIRFLNVRPFASYLCKQCDCSRLEWTMNADSRCTHCNHAGMQHVSVFNQELLNPIQKFGNKGPGKEAFRKLRLMTDRIMLRRLKKDHTNAMELPVKEVFVDRQFFGEVENDFANSIMTSGQRRFDTYVAQGVLLNNYANIFGLIMQMRQVADHPDLILKKNADGGQNILVCCICDEPSEDTVRSRCKHDFCRACVASYVRSTAEPDCPRCHISLSIDLEQPEIEQDENLVKKSSIINRIKMENWTSSSKIELLVHELHKLRSDNASHKSIIFSQFTTMLQLIEWRLRRAGITTVMLDGSMTPAQRQASIEHFMTNVNVECFLVSLKAGGVALNLTEASRVFIVDPWWNPAAEWQSADRCHRIGQTRPCTITRLCIEDSVESRMVLIQEKKTNMIHSTVNNDDKAMDSLTPADMQFLFRGS